MRDEEKLRLHLIAPGDHVEITHGAHFAEVTRLYAQDHRTHYDDLFRRTPVCHACRAELYSDGIDVYCPNLTCSGVALSRIVRFLSYWDRIEFVSDQLHHDTQEIFGDIKDLTLADALVRRTRHGPAITDAIIDDLFDISRERRIDDQLQNTKLACFLDGLAIPELITEDITSFFTFEMTSGMDDPFADYFCLLTDSDLLAETTGMSHRTAERITRHVVARRRELVDIFDFYSKENLRDVRIR